MDALENTQWMVIADRRRRQSEARTMYFDSFRLPDFRDGRREMTEHERAQRDGFKDE